MKEEELLNEIRSLVFVALGEASMAWEEIPKGVFDSDKAKNIGDRLMKDIEYLIFDKPE